VQKLSVIIALSTFMLACGKTSSAPVITFLSKPYQLGSFNQKQNATWEYVTGGENVNNWTTLLTLIDRPDAHTAPELDRLAEGIMSTYKSHGGQILLAKTLRDKSGAPFNYLVAAFEEPAKSRFELNFVKIALSPKNAYIVVYGARVSDPQDYKAKGKEFLNQHSSEIGRALDSFPLPDLKTLPRKEF
jgi:hypothetical protein